MILKQVIIIGLFEKIIDITQNLTIIKSKLVQNYINNLDFIKEDDYFCLDQFWIDVIDKTIGFNATVNVMNDTEDFRLDYDTITLYT